MTPLRVTLNANVMLAPLGGIGQYVSELSHALLQRDDVDMQFVYGLTRSKALPTQSLRRYSTLSALTKRLLPSPYRLKRWVERRTLVAAIRQHDSDVYHEPSLWAHPIDRPTVMTLHDLTHIHYPQTQPADRLQAIEQSLKYSLASSRRILCVSEFTATQAVQHYGVDRERICLTPLGVSPCFRPHLAEETALLLQSLGLTHRRFLLFVGTLEPRKNIELILQSIHSLPATMLAHCPLVLCGAYGWGELPPTLATLIKNRKVLLTGYLERPALCALMGSAQMLLFPSLYEGFGLPILEAMASGTPVITSNCASMPEVGGTAAHYVDPHDPTGLILAIEQLHEDRKYWQQLQALGLKRAQEFTWARTAESTMAAYRAVLK